MLLLRALVARFWKTALHAAAGALGHAAARPLHAAALRRGRHPRRRRRPARGRLRLRATGSRRSSSSASRATARCSYDGIAARAAAGDRALARAGRGGERQRHRALRRFVGRAPAGEGHRHDRRAATSSPATAARCRCAPTGVPGEYVAGVRYRAWSPPVGAAPDDRRARAAGVRPRRHLERARRSAAAPTTSSHPGGRNYDTFPVNANEAEARRVARFWAHGHTPGDAMVADERVNPATPTTLDLRWQPGAA